jgi:hypothetical protein
MEADDGKTAATSPGHPILEFLVFTPSRFHFLIWTLWYQNIYFQDDTIDASSGYAGFTGLIDTFLGQGCNSSEIAC